MKRFTRLGVRVGLVLAVIFIVPSISPAITSALAVTDHTFNYTITATGTEDVTTYPNQVFTWTVTATGTETWTEAGYLEQYVGIAGYQWYRTVMLLAPPGFTITHWDYTPLYHGEHSAGDAGTYIDTTNNRLVIRVYSGGYRMWMEQPPPGHGQWAYFYGRYEATYRTYGYWTHSETMSCTGSGSGSVNATEGSKRIATCYFSPLLEHGGVVSDIVVTVTSDNSNVNVTSIFSPPTSVDVYASTSYSETVPQLWSSVETGSASVNAPEGNKDITTSTLVAPNGDTSWSVTDDNPRVDTWMDGNKLYTSVINQAPTADAKGPYSGYEGAAITFDGSSSSDPDGTIVAYEWDLDGLFDDATEPTTSHTWGDNFDGNIGLKVTDDDGATDKDATTVTISNMAPTVDAGPDQTVNEGDMVSFNGSFTDPGWLDTHTIHWDFGEGSTASGTLTPTHAYGDNGVYTVTLTVTDDDGGLGQDTLTLTVTVTVPSLRDLKEQVINCLSMHVDESKRISKVIKKIDESLDPKRWMDETHLDYKHGKKVFDYERYAVKELMHLLKGDVSDKKDEISDEALACAQEGIAKLVEIDRILAETLIIETEGMTITDPKKQEKVNKELAKAHEELDKGDADRDAGKPDTAIKHYKKAWEHAQKAMK